MAKLKIGLIFGGRSGEHEVSLVSARSIYQALDKKKYDVTLIGIDKAGLWHIIEAGKLRLSHNIRSNANILPAGKPLKKNNNFKITYPIRSDQIAKLQKIDVFFPITHGTFGEDGCLQGFLEMLGAAYVGAGVAGSALGMDKDLMKRVLRDAGIDIANFFTLRRKDISAKNISSIINSLKLPIFVKPANLGSSVGVSRAGTKNELKKAIELAFQYDNKIILEECIRGKEIECSVLGNEHPIASVPGEIKLNPGHFYSYEAKYTNEKLATPVPCADLPEKIIKKVQETAIKVFKVLNCEGMGRVDFFLTPKGKLYANEINTLPGFTSFSMYPKMFEHSGVPYKKLLDDLIKYAIERKRRNDKLKRSYRDFHTKTYKS